MDNNNKWLMIHLISLRVKIYLKMTIWLLVLMLVTVMEEEQQLQKGYNSLKQSANKGLGQQDKTRL